MFMVLYFLVDCQWSSWNITDCNGTCGDLVFRTKTREILTKAAFGGKECTGNSTQVEKCNVKPCPGKSCYNL